MPPSSKAVAALARSPRFRLPGAALGVEPVLNRLPARDVRKWLAGVSRTLLGYAPRVRREEGILRFVERFRAANP